MLNVSGKLFTDTTNLKKCSCCNNYYISNDQYHDEKLGIDIPKEYIADNKQFCSYGCLLESGYNISSFGNIIKFDGVHKKINKKRLPLRIDNSSQSHPFCIGFEIEKEDEIIYNKIKKTGIKIPPGWYLMEDTSLKTGYGFELVSPAYNLYNKKLIQNHFSKYRRLLDAEFTNSCGGHISISKYDKSGEQLALEYKTLIAFFLCLYPNRLKNVNINFLNYMDLKKINRKHKPIHYSGPRLELRMITSVKTAKQLWRRLNTIEWFLYTNPDLENTILEMQKSNGFLKKLYKPIFGIEKWPQIVNRFQNIYNWFWDNRSSEDSTYSGSVKKYMNMDLSD